LVLIIKNLKEIKNIISIYLFLYSFVLIKWDMLLVFDLTKLLIDYLYSPSKFFHWKNIDILFNNDCLLCGSLKIYNLIGLVDEKSMELKNIFCLGKFASKW
jgi:hypothetical protein